jgi:DoxX-like family
LIVKVSKFEEKINMKANKIFYWIFTGIVAAMMYFSTYAYLTDPMVAQGFHHLGFPDYFRVELGIAKFIGATLLLLPVYNRVKEWTYSAFVVVFISAFIAHTCSGDPIQNRVMPVVMLGFLVGSYITYHKLNGSQAPAKA